MSKRIVNTCIRLNLDNEADRRAWDYLRRLDKKEHKSYSRIFVTAVNEYFERHDRLADDSYLETRAKEDAFLQTIVQTISRTLAESAAILPVDGRTGEVSPVTAAPSSSNDIAAEEAIQAALDFVDSF